MAPSRKGNSLVDAVEETGVDKISHRHDYQRSGKFKQNDQKETKDIHKEVKKRTKQVSNNTSFSKFNPMATIPEHERTERDQIPGGKSEEEPAISRPRPMLKTAALNLEQGIDAPTSSSIAARERRRKRV